MSEYTEEEIAAMVAELKKFREKKERAKKQQANSYAKIRAKNPEKFREYSRQYYAKRVAIYKENERLAALYRASQQGKKSD